MRSFLLLVILFTLQPEACHTFPDEPSDWIEFLSDQPKQFSYNMDLNGKINFHQYPKHDDTVYPIIEFFDHPTIVAELELDEDEKTALKKAFDSWQKDWEQDLARLTEDAQLNDRDSRRERLEKLEDFRTKLNKKLQKRLDALLSERQRNRLQQIQIRFLIHQRGFYQLLNHQIVQELVGISPLDAELFEQKQSEIALGILRQRIAEITSKAIAIWLEDLPPEQRATIKERWKQMLSPGFEMQQLMIQLNSKIKLAEFDPKNPFDLTSNWPQFYHDVAGNCVFRHEESKRKDLKSLYKLYWIQHLVRSVHFKRDNELVEEQIEMFKELTEQWQEYASEINHQIGQKHNVVPRTLGTGEQVRVVYTLNGGSLQEFENTMAEEARNFCEKYFEVLLPHQMDNLKDVVTNINTRSQGPLAELLWGDLGRVLELEEDEKEALKEKADEAREFLESESKRIYNESLEQLIETVPANDREKLRVALGPAFEKAVPNIHSFSVALLADDPSRSADHDK